jgi:hypothetical protein
VETGASSYFVLCDSNFQVWLLSIFMNNARKSDTQCQILFQFLDFSTYPEISAFFLFSLNKTPYVILFLLLCTLRKEETLFEIYYAVKGWMIPNYNSICLL